VVSYKSSVDNNSVLFSVSEIGLFRPVPDIEHGGSTATKVGKEWSLGRGVPLPFGDGVWGGGCAPSPEKN